MTSNSFGTRDRLTVDDTSYVIHRLDRIDGALRLPVEADCYCHGGILPYMLRQLLGDAQK